MFRWLPHLGSADPYTGPAEGQITQDGLGNRLRWRSRSWVHLYHPFDFQPSFHQAPPKPPRWCLCFNLRCREIVHLEGLDMYVYMY